MQVKPARSTTRAHIMRRGTQLGLLSGIERAYSYLNALERRQLYWVLVVTLFNAALGLVGLASIVPFFKLLVVPDPLARGTVTGDLFHSIGVSSNFTALVIAGCTVVFLILLKNIFGVYHMRVTGRFTASVETRIAADLLNRIVDAPFDWYLRQNSSVLRDMVMTHVIELSRGFIRPVLGLVNNSLLLLTALALMLPLTPAPALIIAALTGVIALALIKLTRPKIALASRRKRHDSVISGLAATEAISGGRDVRMSRAGQLLKSEFRKSYSGWAYSDAATRQWQLIPRSGIEVIGMSALMAIALLALALGIDRLEVASMLALYAVIAIRLLPVIGDTASALSLIQIALPNLSHLAQLQSELAPVVADVERLPDDWTQLELTNVQFRYLGSTAPAVNGIDLTIRRGLSYGVAGSSGAGKSTLADLVAGLLMPTSGQVRLEGVSLESEAALASWRRRVSYVSQSPIIFDISLAENIALGSLDSDRDERLREAIDAAGLTEVVAGLEGGLSTPIGDRGTRLSGGQRQRVAIARAIYQDADLMVLDEATSALDSLTEQEVANAIDNLKGKVTIVAIAHRLSTIMHCDEIVLLDRGSIIAKGSHSELLASSPAYRSFVEAQSLMHVP